MWHLAPFKIDFCASRQEMKLWTLVFGQFTLVSATWMDSTSPSRRSPRIVPSPIGTLKLPTQTVSLASTVSTGSRSAPRKVSSAALTEYTSKSGHFGAFRSSCRILPHVWNEHGSTYIAMLSRFPFVTFLHVLQHWREAQALVWSIGRYYTRRFDTSTTTFCSSWSTPRSYLCTFYSTVMISKRVESIIRFSSARLSLGWSQQAPDNWLTCKRSKFLSPFL